MNLVEVAPRRVVVTGAAGWVGSSVVGALSASDHLSMTGLTRDAVDLAIPGAFADALGDGAATTVVHLAASLDRSNGPVAEASQWRDTFLAGREVVQASVVRGVDHLVIAGTMDELGGADGIMTRDLPSAPWTTYGLCKALVREVAEFEARRGRVLIDWFRPTVVYGPRQQGPMLVPQACAAARSGEPLAVTDGRQLRDFLYVDDLVSWIRLAVERRLTAARPEYGFALHHLGSGRATPVGDVLDRIEAGFSGARFLRGARPRRSQEPDIQVAPLMGTTIDTWKANTAWEVGITRTIDWWKSVQHV